MAVTRSGGKRRKISGCEYSFNDNDFISKLPDGVLLTILEKLPAKYSVRTSVLSRRWEHVWKSVSYVNVCKECDGEKNSKLFLKSFIRSNRVHKLKSFSVFLNYNGYKKAACSWVSFALSKKVEELSMRLFIREYDWRRKPYPIVPLPGNLFNSSSLVRVFLTFVNLDPLPAFNLLSLKELHLDRSHIPADGVLLITANCRLLEHLVLSNCNRDGDLKITVAAHSNLLKLTVDDRDRLVIGQPPETSITAPKVTTLMIVGNSYMRKYSLDKVPDVFAATLNFPEMKINQEYPVVAFILRVRTIIRSLIEKLVHARMLRLCSRSILAVMEMRDIKFNLFHLELDTYLGGPELMGIYALLNACRQLRELVVNIMMPRVVYLDDDRVTDVVMHPLERLTCVEFKNLDGEYQTWNECEFSRKKFFLGLENGVKLLKLLKSPFAQVQHFIFTTRLQQIQHFTVYQ